MTLENPSNKFLVTQLHIPFSMTYTFHLERWFKSSEQTFSRLFFDNESKKYFCKASELKKLHPQAYVFATISNPYYRVFLAHKNFKKVNNSNLNLTGFVNMLVDEPIVKNCSDYLDTEIDFVIKNENFETQFSSFIEKLNLPNRLIKLKYYEPFDAKVFFNSESIKLVRKVFEKDFTLHYNKISER